MSEEILVKLKAERDMWKARADAMAMESDLYGNCLYCSHGESSCYIDNDICNWELSPDYYEKDPGEE